MTSDRWTFRSRSALSSALSTRSSLATDASITFEPGVRTDRLTPVLRGAQLCQPSGERLRFVRAVAVRAHGACSIVAFMLVLQSNCSASAARAAESPQAALYQDEAFMAIRRGFETRTLGDLSPLLSKPLLQRPAPVSMVIDEVERVWAAIAEGDDWAPFDAKLADIEEMRETLGLAVTNL